VIASKQNSFLGQRIQNTGRVHVFPLLLLVLNFFLEIYFEAHHEKTYFLSPSLAVLIWVLKLGLFFIWGFKINFQEEIKTRNGKGKTWPLLVF
jgi:hypothetical protein